MPHSTRLSSISAPCRLEWRPSRWLIAALLLLGLLAGGSVLTSNMPMVAAWPLALLAVGWGAWLAWREARRPARQLLWPRGDAPMTLDGESLRDPQLSWRGPLAFLRWCDDDGRIRRLSWWPDTLPSPARRELRLAATVNDPAQLAQSMAP